MAAFKSLIKIVLGVPALKIKRLIETVTVDAERKELSGQLGKVGPGFEISPPWDIRGPEHVFIGSDVYFGPEVLLIASPGAEIRFGNKIMLGPRVRIIANHHRHDLADVPIRDSGYLDLVPIILEDDVWIGAGATILKGVTIGKGAVIGAGAVITRNVPPMEVWAGNPARCVKKRFATTASI
jgi:galactoside O-acetyltransferase